MAFPKKNRKKIIINGVEFHYRNAGCTITPILNTKTGELIKFNENNYPSPEKMSTMTPKDVETVIKQHYNWL
jgi:hypothetical protein